MAYFPAAERSIQSSLAYNSIHYRKLGLAEARKKTLDRQPKETYKIIRQRLRIMLLALARQEVALLQDLTQY